MNRIIFITISLLLSWQAQAQFFIGPGATVSTGGSDVAVLTLENLDFVNEGVFEPGSSDVYFISNSGNSLSIGGSGSTAYDYLYVHAGDQQLVLNQDIEASLVLFESGLFDLNGHDLVLNNIIVDENENRYFIGPNGGAIIHQATLDAPSGENPGRLGATITSDANLGQVTIRRTHVPAVNDGGESIARRYTITPANNSNLDATLRFSYLSHELNGLPESELVLWENSSSGWSLEGATDRNASANWVELSGINSFAEWAAATPGFTPVIELDGKGAMVINGLFPNPLQQGERLTVAINSPAAIAVQLDLADQLGRILSRQTLQLNSGEQQAGIETQGLPAGLYYLTISAGHKQQTLKVILQ